MPIEEANGLKFHTQHLTGGQPSDDGDGGERTKRPQVVMLHGLVIDNLSSWYYTLANPVAMVADVHLVDLRGHGRSTSDGPWSIAQHVTDLLDTMDAHGLASVDVLGHSYGGAIALALALLAELQPQPPGPGRGNGTAHPVDQLADPGQQHSEWHRRRQGQVDALGAGVHRHPAHVVLGVHGRRR